MSRSGEKRADAGEAYNEYLDACLRGDAPDAHEFLARHPGLDQETSDRILGLHAALGALSRTWISSRRGGRSNSSRMRRISAMRSGEVRTLVL